jgi:type I restriction enzyme S subunit
LFRLGDVIADLQNGWSPKCLDRPANTDEWGVLKLGAVSFGEYDESANKALPPQLKARPDYEVRAGDVLITRGNVLSLVGAAVYVSATRKRLMLPDLVFRVVWKEKSLIDGPFLAALMRMSILRQQIEAIATGTSPTMKKVTKPGLLDLNIPLPPLLVQKQIMERVSVGCVEISREREAADRLAKGISADLERLILGRDDPGIPARDPCR